MDWIRKPAVAGSFYPSDPSKLNQCLDDFLKSSDEAHRRHAPRAIIAPHAGYLYSGKFAGLVYQRLLSVDKAIVLCPNHSGLGPKVSVWSEGHWDTPLGSVSIDKKMAESFLKRDPEAKKDQEAHRYEHAIEVHLPFLQRLNPKIEILPIVLGPLRWEACEAVAKAVIETAKDSGALIIASTDMSHYISRAEAQQKDALALAQIERVSGEDLYRVVVQNAISMCGFIPTACTLRALASQGAHTAKLIAYGDSGEVTRDTQSVVAYASAEIL
jgi:MEMO1 family protein